MILFDKGKHNNWSLGWHQDRTIAVRQRLEVDDFGPWTVKAGIAHVAPPLSLLASMITLRVHLDDVGLDNAPLLVALGTHRIGLINEADVEAVATSSETFTCKAKRGDIWAYATLILHRSEKSSLLTRRRVLQIDYAADALPGGLEWLGT